jgi:hypothetical protein
MDDSEHERAAKTRFSIKTMRKPCFLKNFPQLYSQEKFFIETTLVNRIEKFCKKNFFSEQNFFLRPSHLQKKLRLPGPFWKRGASGENSKIFFLGGL